MIGPRSTTRAAHAARHPQVAAVMLAIIVAACGSGAGASQSPRPVASAARPSTGASAAATNAPAPNAPAYRAGAATARLTMEGKTFEFVDGTCAQPAVMGHQFTLVSGKPLTTPSFEISVVDLSNPIRDGEYATGLDLVSFNVDGKNHAVGSLRTTFRDGVTAGEFRGQNANPAVPVSGSFDCG